MKTKIAIVTLLCASSNGQMIQNMLGSFGLGTQVQNNEMPDIEKPDIMEMLDIDGD